MTNLIVDLRIDSLAGLVPEVVRRDCARAADEIEQLRELLREVLMDDDSNVDAAVGLTYGLVARIRSALGST